MTSSVLQLDRPEARTATFGRAVDGAMDALFTLNDSAATEILLVRHGEPNYDTDGELALSAHGRAQVARLANRLRLTDLHAVCASPDRVAVETAALLAEGRSFDLIKAPELRDLELNPAALNGQLADPQKLAAELSIRFINHPRWDALRGVESTRTFRHRVVQAIESIISRHPGQQVAIVTNQSAINAYLSMVLGIERDMFFQPEFASVSTVRILRDLYPVRAINDCAHLTTERITNDSI
jgi:probable phosphoglycerate mutase